MTDSHYTVLDGDGGACVSCLHSKPGTSLGHVYTPRHRPELNWSQEPVPSGAGREAPCTVFGLPTTNMRKTLPLTSLPAQARMG